MLYMGPVEVERGSTHEGREGGRAAEDAEDAGEPPCRVEALAEEVGGRY